MRAEDTACGFRRPPAGLAGRIRRLLRDYRRLDDGPRGAVCPVIGSWLGFLARRLVMNLKALVTTLVLAATSTAALANPIVRDHRRRQPVAPPRSSSASAPVWMESHRQASSRAAVTSSPPTRASRRSSSSRSRARRTISARRPSSSRTARTQKTGLDQTIAPQSQPITIDLKGNAAQRRRHRRLRQQQPPRFVPGARQPDRSHPTYHPRNADEPESHPPVMRTKALLTSILLACHQLTRRCRLRQSGDPRSSHGRTGSSTT